MKLTYAKPVVSKVELVADQAVLSGCKTTNVGGGQTALYPDSINCESGSNQCYLEGS